MRRVLDDNLGVNPQISIFCALRLLKIKKSGGGNWDLKKYKIAKKIEIKE